MPTDVRWLWKYLCRVLIAEIFEGDLVHTMQIHSQLCMHVLDTQECFLRICDNSHARP